MSRHTITVTADPAEVMRRTRRVQVMHTKVHGAQHTTRAVRRRERAALRHHIARGETDL